MIGDTISYPSYAKLLPSGQSFYTWAASTSDARALQRASSGRIAATWYASTSFQTDVNLIDGNVHQVALYVVDWDSAARSERIDVLDASNNQVLNTQTVSSFHGGEYLIWNVSGHVIFKITTLAGGNSVLSGLFFDTIRPPTITQNPVSTSVGVGQSATFSVTATGNSLSYQWQTSPNASSPFVNIAGATSASYITPTTVLSDDGKQFQVIVANITGTATSSIATLGVSIQPPVITQNPSNTLVSAGQVASFSVVATGSNLTYQWQTRSNTSSPFANITGATSASYVTLATVLSDNGKQFQVVVTNSVGAVTSSLATLMVTAGPSVSFIHTDTVTQGNWSGTYGADGYNVIGDTISYPSYAKVLPSGQSFYTWAASTSDARALQRASSGRIAATWYASTSFQTDVNLIDGNVHQVALYVVDWDSAVRSERIDVLDASNNQVLNTQTVSSFHGGEYLIWNVSGHVIFKITTLAGGNSVLSGLFFDTIRPPTITQNPVSTSVGVGQSATFSVTATGNSLSYQWQTSPNASSPFVNIAGATSASYITPTTVLSDDGKQFQVIVANITGTATSSIATLGVSIQPPVITQNPSNTLVSAGQVASFSVVATGSNLTYQWQTRSNTSSPFANITGATSASYVTLATVLSDNGKQFQVVVTNSVGAVTSSLATLMVTAGPSVSFIHTDTVTQGNWNGTYGADGYNVIGDTISYPSYAQVLPSGQSFFTWAASTSDARALQRASSGRIAATWYASTSFQTDVNLIDGNVHQVALYVVDWDSAVRSERIDVLDASNNQVLNTQTVSSFHGGEYLIWNVSGHVIFKITTLAGSNSVLSGLFFSAAADTTPPTVSLIAPSASSTVSGTILISANASDDRAVAGVRFTVDGNPIGVEVPNLPYSTVIDTTTLGNGTHNISATARDAANNTQTKTVTVTVINASGLNNPIKIENASTGTSAWQLVSPATNAEIQGYASLTSVNVGGQISFFVSTPDLNYNMDIYRMGWYSGAGARELSGPITLPGIVQPAPTVDPGTGLIECHWTNPYVLTVPTNWTSGIYLVKLTANTSGKQSYIIFVVRDDNRPSSIIFQSSVTTYEAYNNWGGKSLYAYNSTGANATKVSFNRPYALGYNPASAPGVGAGHFLTNAAPATYTSPEGWEYNMVRWLERNGYDVTYLTDVDVHETSNALNIHRAFLSVGHDEYWSWNQRQNVENARDHGINLGFFAADVCYWQVRFEPGFDGQIDRTIVGYKESALTSDPYALDSDPTNDKYITTLWRANNTKPPENRMVGVAYLEDPVNTDIVIANASNWVFNSTGLKNGSHLPGLLGYEVDGILKNSPPGLQTLGASPVPNGTSYMTLYTASSGAQVFGAGSIQWAWGLDDDYFAPALRPSVLNVAAQQITANVLNQFSK